MVRTVIAKTLLATALLLVGVLAGPLATAASEGGTNGSEGGTNAFEEGEHYERLPIPVDTRNPDQVEVVEVFSYGCIHCKNFQGAIDAWQEGAPESVDFYRMPATFSKPWESLAQLFYTAEALDVTAQVHDPIFRAIHDNGVNLTEPERMAELFERVAGIEPEQFNSVFNSFSVRSRVQQAHARGLTYRLSGTPTLIVDGTYRVDGRMAGGNAAMLEVVDYLVAERQQSEAGSAP